MSPEERKILIKVESLLDLVKGIKNLAVLILMTMKKQTFLEVWMKKIKKYDDKRNFRSISRKEKRIS